AAAEALGELGNPLAVLPLTKVLDDEDARVRTTSVEALVKLGESSTDSLINTLRVTNNKARRAAAEPSASSVTPARSSRSLSPLRITTGVSVLQQRVHSSSSTI